MKTKNYSKFVFSKENREIKPKTVMSLKESMKKFGFITGRPVLVTKEFVIIDGQHRYLVCKKNELLIYYIICEGYHIPQCQTLNNKPSTSFPATTYQTEDGIEKGESSQFITGCFE